MSDSTASPPQIPPEAPVSDGTPSVTSSANPDTPTSSPPGQSPPTEPPAWPALPPGYPPSFALGRDGVTYYSNTTIDDFSPLITFSRARDWVTLLNDNNNATKPIESRNWFLGTYKKTEERNATVTLEFWGSEIHLYGDSGPAYGAFALTLDDGTPTLHSAFFPALAVGKAHLLHSLRDLTEGRHELAITALGTREGLLEGPAFLFDFAIVTQKVGVPGRSRPQAVDTRAEALTELTTNGTWALNTVQDDVPPGEGGAKPEIYIERKAFWTDENLATLTHTFKGTAVQVFGGWNATHGAYRATLTDTNSSTVVHSKVYNTTTACDPSADSTVHCEWRGSALKYSVADLDPDLQYELTLQNLHRGNGTVFEIDLIRVIDLQDGGEPGTPGSQTGAGYMNGANPLANLLILLVSFLAIRRALRL